MDKGIQNTAEYSPAQLKAWGTLHAYLCLLGGALFWISESGLYLAIISALSFALLVFSRYAALAVTGTFGGLANQITLFRFGLVLVVLVELANLTQPWVIGLFTVVVVLDVLDGFVARKLAQTSLLGMHLDMEVDALFVLAAGCYFYLTTDLGIILLLPGALRYLYVLCISLIPRQNFVERKRRYAAWAAGANFCLLILASATQGNTQTNLLLISCAVVCLSFFVSFVEYFASHG